jgi:AcrR family transcriptional regulator
MGEEGQRRWAGTTLDVRRAARREQLIEVGFALLGEQGASAVTVRGAARAAHLSERYFYESFSDRDALLLAVHDRVAEQARDVIARAVGAAVQAGSADLAGPGPETPDLGAANLRAADLEAPAIAALQAFTDFLEEDPRRGRVLLAEAFSDQTLVRHGVELLPSFAALLVEQISARYAGPDKVDAELSAVALVGALAHLYLGWIDGSLAIPRERLIRHAARLLVAAAAIHSHDV